MQKVRIEYTLTLKTCVDHIAVFLRHTGVEPKGVIANILDEFEGKVSAFPLGCQVCPELLNLGVSKYRECNSSDGYRVVYSTEGSTVTAHAILSHRQDVKQLLFKRLIQA
ncbi:type II toxin-antitoxin system RelE/ParE family toxin [Enterobacteriaceae bacterium RIT693]|jgi:plasmid stabilization system protein ParE|nr:type II toxin-antitoxin system RelE/ParE family toxin [Enterobacteriaceae bacterium RIT693]